jgi:hypothetical protein
MTHVCSESIAPILGESPAGKALSALLGWALAALAVAVGWAGYGVRGVVLALTVTVFWLLLQFSRALRVMGAAAARPLGRVDSVVMLQSRLQVGMRLLQVVALAKSLGEKLADAPETFAWRDAGGDTLRVEFDRGRVSAWRLQRVDAASAPEAEAGRGA